MVDLGLLEGVPVGVAVALMLMATSSPSGRRYDVLSGSGAGTAITAA